jgi:hypothetical protein
MKGDGLCVVAGSMRILIERVGVGGKLIFSLLWEPHGC